MVEGLELLERLFEFHVPQEKYWWISFSRPKYRDALHIYAHEHVGTEREREKLIHSLIDDNKIKYSVCLKCTFIPTFLSERATFQLHVKKCFSSDYLRDPIVGDVGVGIHPTRAAYGITAWLSFNYGSRCYERIKYPADTYQKGTACILYLYIYSITDAMQKYVAFISWHAMLFTSVSSKQFVKCLT